jgi:biopolymer transport protein ExbB/TolQ
MKKFISLGTECVEFLKATRVSQGNFFAMLCLMSVSFCSSPILFLTFFSLFCIADALSMANARIASLEAKLEASKKAWDIATAAKAAAEKSAKTAVAKAKKAEKALADANQGRIQREEAITKCLNQVSALAGGCLCASLHHHSRLTRT